MGQANDPIRVSGLENVYLLKRLGVGNVDLSRFNGYSEGGDNNLLWWQIGKLPMAKHDSSYNYLFSHASMVEDLLRGFVKEDWVEDLDFATLEKVSGSYVSRCKTIRWPLASSWTD